MNPPILTQFAAPDPNAAPLTVAQLVALLNLLVSSEIQGSYIPYIVQAGTPGVEDQDKSWLELDSNGRPIDIKIFWHGHWRRVYNGMPGEIRGYSGDPSVDFDSRGLGKVGLTYDGWHLCNGMDGTPDYTDKFPIGAHLNNVGHPGYNPTSGQWETWVNNTVGEHTGGAKDFTLGPTNTWSVYEPPVRARLWSASTNAPAPHTGGLWGLSSNTNDSDNDNIAPAIPGNQTPDKVNVINPFVAQAWIIFVGYA
jgi:hypothetical protein